MSLEIWFYDEEREEVVDCTLPDGRSAAPSYPIARMVNHQGLNRKQIDALGNRVAGLPELERECARLRGVINEVNSWAVCHCITSDEDMMQSIERIVEITTLSDPEIEQMKGRSVRDSLYQRPKTRGELRDLLESGQACEVASQSAEMTEIMLKGWLDFDAFTVRKSPNEGWTLFEPLTKD
jgi:hypothetical protein